MLTEEQKNKILELKGEGYSDFKIGKMLGVDPKTVAKHSRGNNGGGRKGSSPFIKNRHPESREGRHTFIPKERVIPVTNPSQRVVNQREDVEVTELEVRKEKATQELQKIQTPKEYPALVEKRARVEVARLDVDEFEARKKLEALKKEEIRKTQAKEEGRIQREIERQRLAEEQDRLEKRQRWIRGWQDWALNWGISLPWGVSLPSALRFQVRDKVGEILQNRSENENRWEIEKFIKEAVNSIIKPYLSELEVKNKAEEAKRREARKVQLIQLWALPEVGNYIRVQGLEPYVDEESKGKIKEFVRNHFMKTLTGNESFIFSHEVTNLLDTFFKPVKEKIKQAQEEERREKQEREKREREKREAEEKAFWEKVKKEREEENEKERIEELLQVGINRFSWYLTIHRKELEPLKNEERERARRHFGKELKEQIEGTETDEEIEKISDEILDDFFFEE